eukprot:NODE_115_length_3200_cov_23.413202_g105_i0.p2 GENE.NODE_115_length_3200_cov_23.413202_g105_i0~~NODE_115_length_3200_cov_23.413202_g105_i0.p2  ORF type:complete len:241 (+),score=9.13 NODE_115_length_3200_cov_23.413202_g105_i0:2323-3045(+)
MVISAGELPAGVWQTVMGSVTGPNGHQLQCTEPVVDRGRGHVWNHSFQFTMIDAEISLINLSVKSSIDKPTKQGHGSSGTVTYVASSVVASLQLGLRNVKLSRFGPSSEADCRDLCRAHQTESSEAADWRSPHLLIWIGCTRGSRSQIDLSTSTTGAGAASLLTPSARPESQPQQPSTMKSFWQSMDSPRREVAAPRVPLPSSNPVLNNTPVLMSPTYAHGASFELELEPQRVEADDLDY